tara:strand:- start:5 stop:163 length:159 start_codon:yes stop_codon:yes gene_type:complete
MFFVNWQVEGLGIAAKSVGHDTGRMKEMLYSVFDSELEGMIGPLKVDVEYLV